MYVHTTPPHKHMVGYSENLEHTHTYTHAPRSHTHNTHTHIYIIQKHASAHSVTIIVSFSIFHYLTGTDTKSAKSFGGANN